MALIQETYDALSLKTYTQASPTYFNIGTDHPQLASCFLLGTADSEVGIMDGTACQLSKISKWGGGLGVHVNNWRSQGSLIRGTNGASSGVVPFLRIYENIMCAFNQGGKRPGSLAVYMMPHHPDIMAFLQLKLPGGEEKFRARILHYGLWIPNLFMERLKTNEPWSLFDPDECGDLSDYVDTKDDPAYTRRYLELEEAKRYRSQVSPRDIWKLVYDSNRMTGEPYICFSDHVNQMSQQSNLGPIKSSNLCAEIVQYSNDNETAVCNLCSISLASCVNDRADPESKEPPNDQFPTRPYFDFDQLKRATRLAVTNLNRIIDINYYPTENSKRSNMRHRPIGIGVQGLADAFIKMRFPFDSAEAAELNKQIFETIYYIAITKSATLAREEYFRLVRECKEEGSVTVTEYGQPTADGVYSSTEVVYTDPEQIPKKIGAYPSLDWNGGSPISKGIFHWELYGLSLDDLSFKYDWGTTAALISKFGVRNSLLTAIPPTASTSQFLGNNECVEPYTTNLYKRSTLAGECIVFNQYLVHDLYRLGLWSSKMRVHLMRTQGSVQSIENLPAHLKLLYRTAYELDQSTLVKLAGERQPFIDQSQSLNWYIRDLTLDLFNRLVFQAYQAKLKTPNYYIHTEAGAEPQKFTLDPRDIEKASLTIEQELAQVDISFLDKSAKKPECDGCGA
jgi:ribonucleotide reductase alpha subunit